MAKNKKSIVKKAVKDFEDMKETKSHEKSESTGQEKKESFSDRFKNLRKN